MRRLASLAAAALVLATAGCLKEKTTITVYPDGSGKIELHETIGPQLAELVLMMAPDDEKRQEAASANLHKELSKWDGVVAWTDAKASARKTKEDKDEIVGAATGYFEDVTKLRKVEDSGTSDFKWTKNKDGSFTIEEVKSETKKEGQKRKDPPGDFLKPMSEEDMKKQIASVSAIFEGLALERTAVLPGDVTEVGPGQKKDGRRATARISDKAVIDFMKSTFAKGAELRKKIDAGEVTEEKARETLEEDMKTFGSPLKATCQAGDVAAEQKANRAALEAAKKEYKDSALEAKVDEARSRR